MTLTYLPDLPTFPGLIWVPFNAGHVAVMNITAQNYQSISKGLDVGRMLEMQANSGHAITAILHGRPVACFGSVKIWTGVEEMWCFLEERARKYPLVLTKAAIDYRDFRVLSASLHRLQITVRCKDKRAVRWGQAIGFEIEGLMKKYGPDQADFYMMSRS
jgi:hypothetical protein